MLITAGSEAADRRGKREGRAKIAIIRRDRSAERGNSRRVVIKWNFLQNVTNETWVECQREMSACSRAMGLFFLRLFLHPEKEKEIKENNEEKKTLTKFF